MNAKRHIDNLIRLGIEWLFRRRSPALFVMRIGLACLALAFGAGWLFSVSIPFRGSRIDLSFDSAGGTPTILVYAAGIVGFLLIGTGVIWEVIRYRTEQKRLVRRRVVVIEARGLRDTSGTPLMAAVPDSLEGHRDSVLIDLRQVRDGIIKDPDAAIAQLVSLPTDLERRALGLDRRDITYVYGGLAAVPLTFLTGVLMDDEGAVEIMDWDRHAGNWRALDGSDDSKRFAVTGVEAVPSGAKEVALAVSVSYAVDAADVLKKVGDVPIVQMDLADGTPDCHWSAAKQQALGKQFLDTVIALGNRGVKRIHLFLAAQNSVVFRFGRLYDKRNLPEVVVYQYQRENDPPYPWGVKMPVSGVATPTVIQ